MSNNAVWVMASEGFAVKALGCKSGDRVSVRSKAGRVSEIVLGRPNSHRPFEFYPDRRPSSIERVGTNLEHHLQALLVDGKSHPVTGTCRTVWEGESQSNRYGIRLGCSVLRDLFIIEIWDHTKGRPVLLKQVTDIGWPWETAVSMLQRTVAKM